MNIRTWIGFFITGCLLIFFIQGIRLFEKEWEVRKVQSEQFTKFPLEPIHLPETSYLLDRDSQLFAEIGPTNRLYVSLDEIPLFLQQLFVLSEDHMFYEHKGFDLLAITRALITNVKTQGIEQGGSTITQQLVRNVYLSHDQTYERKLQEILYAYQLEQIYTKKQILEYYLNAIYFHNGIYGIGSAAQFYFQKRVPDLTKGEQAFLAAIPNNPSKYNPLKHFDDTKQRQERLIDLLVEHGMLTSQEGEQIKREPIQLHLKRKVDRFPDYAVYVEHELKQLIAEQEGYTARLHEATDETEVKHIQEELDQRVQTILESGVYIHTALFPTVQERAVASVQKVLQGTGIQGAAVVIDHTNHEIVAITGGVHYKKYDFHRGFQAFRQPGSAIKPLLVYGPYIERYQPPLTKRVNAGAFCYQGYCPQNYGGTTYGWVSLLQAFAKSYNTPAVRLVHEMGIKSAFQDFNLFSFSRVNEMDQKLPAAIGGLTYGVSPLELTDAYTVFQNGTYVPARAIRKVTDKEGNVLYDWKDERTIVWSEETVKKMRMLLQEVVRTGTAQSLKRPKSSFVGGKTGTTNDFKDFWFIGITDQWTAGVWVGKDRPENLQTWERTNPELRIWEELFQ